MQVSKYISIIPSDTRCILLAPSFLLHPVWAWMLQFPEQTGKAGDRMRQSGSGTMGLKWSAGCCSQNANLNLTTAAGTALLEFWAECTGQAAWLNTSAMPTSAFAQTLDREILKNLTITSFWRETKGRNSLKQNIQFSRTILHYTNWRQVSQPWASLRIQWAQSLVPALGATPAFCRDALTSIEEWRDSSTANEVLQQQALPGNENGNKGGQGVMER